MFPEIRSSDLGLQLNKLILTRPEVFFTMKSSSTDAYDLYKITRQPINVFLISVALISNHCLEQRPWQFSHQYEIKQQPLTGILQS